MPKIQRAWSKKLWRAIAKGLVNPTVNTIIEECKIICRGVFPHRSGGTLVFKDGQTALWQDLTIEERQRWSQAVAGWGWLSVENKPIRWSKETEMRIARLGIWVWTRDMDGPLPKILAMGAQARKEKLEELQLVLNNNGIWQKLGAHGLTMQERLDVIDQLEAKAGPSAHLVRQWADIELELRWKQTTVPKLEKWFLRHPAIPPETRELWLDAWKRS